MTSPSERRPRLAAIGAAAAGSLVLYLLTLTPTVPLNDGGELIAAVKSLGVAHAPGFPLYILLAHAATWLPFGSVAARVNAASAIFGALAVALMVIAAGEALALAPRGATRENARGSALPAATPQPDSAIPALAAALLLACGRTFWNYATQAEVYTLNTAIVVAILALMLRWRRGRTAPAGERGDDRPLLAAAFLFGLGLAVHHVTIALMLPALAMLVLATEGPRFFAGPRFGLALLAALGGLSVYAYLPFAAARSPIMNWGDARSLDRLIMQVTGREYWVFFEFHASQLREEIPRFAGLFAREFGPPWLPLAPVLAAVGLADAWRRDRALAMFLALIVAVNVGYSLIYHISQDQDAYFLPAFVAIALAAGLGASRLLRSGRGGTPHAAGAPRAAGMPRAAAAAFCLVAPAIAFAANLPYDDRHRDTIARDQVENFLAAAKPGGLVLTFDWQFVSPHFYVREIEGRHRDVAVIDVHMMRRSWYVDYVRRAYPELARGHEREFDDYLAGLREWEHDATRFEREAALRQPVHRLYYRLMLALAHDRPANAPVYLTEEVALSPDAQDGVFARAITAGTTLVPQGMLFELTRGGGFRETTVPRLETRALLHGRSRFAADDVVRTQIIPTYAALLLDRGRYLIAYGHRDEAIAMLEQALALDPSFTPAREAIVAARSGGVPAAP
jgi:hypothetical protein